MSKEKSNNIKLVVHNRHFVSSRMHDEFNRLTTGLINLAENDDRITLTQREEDGAVKVYFRRRFVALVREHEKHLEIVGDGISEHSDLNATKAEAAYISLVEKLRGLAA